MQVTLYDPKDPERMPPHRIVIDAMGRGHFEYSSYDDSRERAHREDPAEHSLYPCACCNWKDPTVKKARAKKLKVLNRFLRTGKLPPFKLSICGKSRIPRMMSDEEAAKVVLPFPPLQYKTCGAALHHFPKDGVIERVASRYLKAMGETKQSTKGATSSWSCGCKVMSYVTASTEEQCYPCGRHRGAFEGTEDND